MLITALWRADFTHRRPWWRWSHLCRWSPCSRLLPHWDPGLGSRPLGLYLSNQTTPKRHTSWESTAWKIRCYEGSGAGGKINVTQILHFTEALLCGVYNWQTKLKAVLPSKTGRDACHDKPWRNKEDISVFWRWLMHQCWRWRLMRKMV